MSIVVTGTAGHLGALIVQALLDRGAAPYEVVATGRDTARLQHFAHLGVHMARIDYDDPTTVTGAVGPGDVLVLVSGTAMGHRVQQHTGIIAAAKRAGAGRVVYTSAPKATTTALVLAPEHKATEEYLAQSGVTCTILRNGWYSENYEQQIQAARAQGEFFGSAGDGRIASASRQDFAEAAAVVALDDSYTGRILELAGDTSWTYADLADAIARHAGRPVAYHDLTPEEHLARLTEAGLPEDQAKFDVALDGNTRDGLLSMITGELGATITRPTTTIEATLATL